MSASTSATAGTLHLSPPTNRSFSFTSCVPSSGYSNCPVTRKQNGVVVCSLVKGQEGVVECIASSRRREAMLQMAFSVFGVATTTFAVSPPAHSLEDVAGDFRLYSDDVNKYNISIPKDWEVGTGDSDSFKAITAFYPDNDRASFSNVSVAITGIGADFTKLESFGKVDEFAESLVTGLDRSWQRPPGLAAKLIDCKSKNGLYYVEYTLKNPGESQRHIYSAIGMASNGWYNRLYTVTGQFVEEEANMFSSKIQKAVQSFRFN